MNKEKWGKLLRDSGAAQVEFLKVDRGWFNPKLRAYCTTFACKRYGTNYGCPPAVGEAETVIEDALKYKEAIVYSIVSEVDNVYTPEAMQQVTEKLHSIGEGLIQAGIRKESEALLLGAGGCYHCDECSLLQDKECPTPKWQQASLSAYCVLVQKMVQDAGMTYNNGTGTLTMFGAVLYNEQ